MSKFQCVCGNIISDNTDFISYKARFVSDQDYFDLCDEIENKDFYKQSASLIKYLNDIYQCSQFQNIIFFKNNERFDFQPLEKQQKPTVLKSVFGDKWKGVMTANFYDGKGDVWWYTNVDSGFKQRLSLDQLKEIYYKKFEELKKADLLRSAFLRVEGEIIHDYDAE